MLELGGISAESTTPTAHVNVRLSPAHILQSLSPWNVVSWISSGMYYKKSYAGNCGRIEMSISSRGNDQI